MSASGQAIERKVSQLRCRYCGEVITLNLDGPEARAEGKDPYQQMRKHILSKHVLDVARHTRKAGFLIDMLFFEAVNSPENWRKQISEMVDYLLMERQ